MLPCSWPTLAMRRSLARRMSVFSVGLASRRTGAG